MGNLMALHALALNAWRIGAQNPHLCFGSQQLQSQLWGMALRHALQTKPSQAPLVYLHCKRVVHALHHTANHAKNEWSGLTRASGHSGCPVAT
jgi:hypothetical protein